ncbi:hypothetical protein ACOSQ2_004749 [Xanthoceras sorbifolium]
MSCWRQVLCSLRRRPMVLPCCFRKSKMGQCGCFDFIWVHHPSRENQVVDALSRKEVQGYVAALVTLQVTFLELKDNLLYAKGSRLYVPNGGGLKQKLLKETHDPQWAGHPGVERMVALLMSSAELCMGFQPLTPLEVAQQKDQGLCPAVYRFVRDKTELIECAIESLSMATRQMKKYVDKNRQLLEFNVGDKVLLKLTPQIWKKITDRRYHKGLIQRYDGPFVKRAPPVIQKEFYKQVEKIFDHRSVGESKLNRRTDYMVQWKCKTESEATGESWIMAWTMAWWGGTKQTQGMLGGMTLRQN